MGETPTQNDEPPRNSTQVVPPNVETGQVFEIYNRQVKAKDAAYGVVGFLPGAIASSYAGILGAPLELAGVGLLGSVGLGAGAYLLSSTSGDTSSAPDRVYSRLSYGIRQLGMPFEEDETPALHGVQRIHADGTLEMHDGSIVAVGRVSGRNTDQMTTGEVRPMLARVSNQLDDLVDFGFQLYSTTTEFDPETITDKYRSTWLSDEFAGHEWRHAREVLKSICKWEPQATEDLSGSAEWRHYLVVRVQPSAIDTELAVLESDDQGLIRSYLFGDDDEELSNAERRRMQRMANRRLETVANAWGSAGGIETEKVGPAEHAMLLSEFWAGASHNFDDQQVTDDVDVSVWPHVADDGDPSHQPDAVADAPDSAPTDVAIPSRQEQAVDPAVADGGSTTETVSHPPTDAGSPDEAFDDADAADQASFWSNMREGLFGSGDGADDDAGTPDASSGGDELHTKVARLISGTYFDEGERMVQVGQQYARTYWVADWPVEPDDLFLKQLYSMTDLDLDVCLDAEPVDRDVAVNRLRQKLGSIGTDVNELEESDDVTSVLKKDKLDPYMQLFKLFDDTQARPWEVSGYVTVRVGPRQALETAEQLVDSGVVAEDDLTMDLAKREALEDACERVIDVLESSPARLTVESPEKRQQSLFASASPNQGDTYDGESFSDRRRLCGSGVLATALPMCHDTVRQPDGVEFGRKPSTGQAVVNNPFRPGPAHTLAMGESGSGKTFGEGKKILRWWLADPENRTVVLCDTMGNFKGITDAFNGNHLQIDGTQTINPLHIEPTPPELVSEMKVDPFNMKFSEVMQFLVPIVCPTPEQRDKYEQLLKDAVRNAYIDAGVKPNDPSTHLPENSPTMIDVRDMVADMGENPEKYVTYDLEVAEIEDHAGSLLRKLSGFSEGGEFEALTGKSTVTLEPGEISYLDLQQIEGMGESVDKSNMLTLMLGQVHQLVKRAPGQSYFMTDEAHYLTKSVDMLRWLDQQARHWRQFDAGLWFLTQEPGDFAIGATKEEQALKEGIIGQMKTIAMYGHDRLSDDIADEFGLNPTQAQFLREHAKRGEDGVGYSDYMVNFADQEGAHQLRVLAAPREKDVLSYRANEHGAPSDYFAERWGEEFRIDDDDDSDTETDTDQNTNTMTMTEATETEAVTETDQGGDDDSRQRPRPSAAAADQFVDGLRDWDGESLHGNGGGD